METKQKRTKVVVSALALAALVAFSLTAGGGSLEPSAAPGPTMKTLDEVEPRIPIHASDLPLTITEPNSYYLAENISFAGTGNHAITIECNDVTIDLMGYTLSGPDAGGKSGIFMYGRSNVEIRNGTVRNFQRGVDEALLSGKQHRVINVRAMSNVGTGLLLYGQGHLVKDCTAAENGGSGIYVWFGSTVTGSTASYNYADGIILSYTCRAIDNTSVHNGNGGSGAGIRAVNTGNRIERNNITDNDLGVRIDGSGNVIADNLVKANTDNYDIAAGNQLNILLCEVPETIEWPATVTLAGSLELLLTTEHAITVDSNDVTIDLAGFSLKGPDSGTKSGIYMNGRSNVEVRNGTVRDFYFAIHESSTFGKQHRVINVRAMSNTDSGICLDGESNLIKDCTVAENGNHGIYAYKACTVTGNTACGNGGSGIYANTGCTIADNTATSNNLSSAGSYAGIRVSTGCLVKSNALRANLQNNIYVAGTDNSIEENLVTMCNPGNGINLAGAGNFYANIRASGNGTDFANFADDTSGGGNWVF